MLHIFQALTYYQHAMNAVLAALADFPRFSHLLLQPRVLAASKKRLQQCVSDDEVSAAAWWWPHGGHQSELCGCCSKQAMGLFICSHGFQLAGICLLVAHCLLFVIEYFSTHHELNFNGNGMKIYVAM